MPALAIVGEAAWIWVLRDRTDDRRDAPRSPSFENASTVPGLVLWLSSMLQLDAPPQHAAGLVDFFLREPDAVHRELAGLGLRAGDLVDDADLDRFGIGAIGGCGALSGARGENGQRDFPDHILHFVLRSAVAHETSARCARCYHEQRSRTARGR